MSQLQVDTEIIQRVMADSADQSQMLNEARLCQIFGCE